jgi:hypothetical protein
MDMLNKNTSQEEKNCINEKSKKAVRRVLWKKQVKLHIIKLGR